METAKRLLVVDDDEDIRETLCEAFELAGYEAVAAPDGQAALAVLKAGATPPDAIILDLVMPVLDGCEVHREMQADPSLAAIPVIFSTATPSRAPSGVVVVPKPVQLERMLEMVGELCGEARRRDYRSSTRRRVA